MKRPADGVAVIGQGYVGLPLAVAAATSGYRVIGIDSDETRVGQLNAGVSPVRDVSTDDLRAALRNESYIARTSFAEVKDVEIVVICLPTPYENEAPDLSYVEDGARAVGANMSAGTLVILESTTFPGTTEEVLLPLLEECSKMRAGDGFDLAFSPERIDPGNPTYKLHNTPKIVGGVSSRAIERAATFYGRFVERVVRVSSPATAEMAKLLENTFRHINIALVNELAIVCRDMGIDVWEVIEAAASKPFGFMPFYPGPGVGGHCIPVDPMYLSWRVRQLGGSAKFIELARDINDAMPLYCAARVQDLLNERGRPLKDARIVVLGVAYKANVADVRGSPAIALISALSKKGAIVSYHDPYVATIDVPGYGVLSSVSFEEVATSAPECAVIVTPHSGVDYERLVESGSLVFDAGNHLRSRASNVVTL